MKIDFDQKFTGVPEQEREQVTLASVVYACLNHVDQREPLKLAEAVKRGHLALKLQDGGEQEVSLDDLNLLRSTLNPMLWKPFVIAQASDMLDLPEGRSRKAAKSASDQS